MKPLACACFGLLSVCFAQTPSSPPALQFTGAPLVIPYACTEEDLDWAGLSCAEESCPIYIDLTSAEAQGQTILVAGNLHASAVTLLSLLLRSDDGGRTWREPFARLRGAAFDRIQLLDGANGWIGGETVQPLSMDPFFLVTGDGGKTWDRVPLLEEGTPAAILGFVFDSRDHGAALIHHPGEAAPYELWETQSGGRVWTLKASSQKRPKLPVAAESEWRIQPEAKLFRLEHLEDGRWSPFASFAAHAADCRRKPAAETTEPEPAKPRP